jgi:O-methyltransferase
LGQFYINKKNKIRMNINLFTELVSPFSMTSEQRIHHLFNKLEYIRKNNIEGDVVECGVWKGGNIFGIIEYLSYYKISKKIWLYDTFKGMTKCSEFDTDLNGNTGKFWEDKCDCSLKEVKELMDRSCYDKSLVNYIEGDVCETLENELNIPNKICLLRLDTDWYESTKKELELLYPKLTKKGVLIIDDYGHWNGAKKAVLDYFGEDFLFDSIDYTGISLIK